eukprot:CAMPEP_0195647374 /NCGR_PEP_ID=MMETSP0815-20121206/30056_1 /TAXON_ID=97485 /ORGANISM="Prymnesium parvum, Strain Texoma1" /LENGTH=102 /DNA_ID=CAMNT_0040790921 /DNA_START=694 /DNA_END=1002 /DNA_ORIENTATION=+
MAASLTSPSQRPTSAAALLKVCCRLTRLSTPQRASPTSTACPYNSPRSVWTDAEVGHQPMTRGLAPLLCEQRAGQHLSGQPRRRQAWLCAVIVDHPVDLQHR